MSSGVIFIFSFSPLSVSLTIITILYLFDDINQLCLRLPYFLSYSIVTLSFVVAIKDLLPTRAISLLFIKNINNHHQTHED